jgi:hypothetical protein
MIFRIEGLFKGLMKEKLMRYSMRSFLIAIFVLGLASLACNAVDNITGNATDPPPPAAETVEDAEPTPITPTAELSAPEQSPTATIEATSPVEAEEGDEAPADGETTENTLDLNSENFYGEPTDVETYRISMTFSFTETNSDGSQETGAIIGEGSRRIDPSASTMTLSTEGLTEVAQGGEFSFTQIGETNYVAASDLGCISGSFFNDANPYSTFLDAGGFLGELDGAMLAERDVVVNDILTDMYAFDQTNLDNSDPTNADIQEINGQVYVAKEGFVVRVVLAGIGTGTILPTISGATAEFRYELNYFDINQPVYISVPAVCETVADVDYPVLDDASDVTSAFGVFTYTTERSLSETVDFYRTEMANEGWTLTSEFVSDLTTLFSFSKDGRDIDITLAPNPGGEGAVVVILETP